MDIRDRAALFKPLLTCVDKHAMTAVIATDADSADEDCVEEFVVPIVFELCNTCEGKGSYVNPAIDSNGITQSEWNEWDGDEKDFYMSGGYDITCNACQGERVVAAIDKEKASSEMMKLIKKLEKDREYEIQEMMSEMRFGY